MKKNKNYLVWKLILVAISAIFIVRGLLKKPKAEPQTKPAIETVVTNAPPAIVPVPDLPEPALEDLPEPIITIPEPEPIPAPKAPEPIIPLHDSRFTNDAPKAEPELVLELEIEPVFTNNAPKAEPALEDLPPEPAPKAEPALEDLPPEPAPKAKSTLNASRSTLHAPKPIIPLHDSRTTTNAPKAPKAEPISTIHDQRSTTNAPKAKSTLPASRSPLHAPKAIAAGVAATIIAEEPPPTNLPPVAVDASIPIIIEKATTRGRIVLLEDSKSDRHVVKDVQIAIWYIDEDKKETLLYQTRTDEDGMFSLPELKEGIYRAVMGKTPMLMQVVPPLTKLKEQERAAPKALLILMPKHAI